MNTYTTVSETLNSLKQEGYILDFNLREDCIECSHAGIKLSPEHFVIDKFFRFEGASNPDDSAVIYAISSDEGLKGTVIDAYGVYADSLTTEMIRKLQITR